MNITKIVITGGPCAGKSTAMSWVQNAFKAMGYTVLFVPETATELITGGVAPWSCGTNADFQKCLFHMQLEKEKTFERAAKTMNTDKVLIVCDRGALDNKAYMKQEEFSEVLKDLKSDEVSLRDNYDAVFHLVTAAKGAESFYTTANNTANTANATANTALKGMKVYSGTCSTAAGTAAKVVSCSDTDFEMTNGTTITIKFSTASTVASPTLNVNTKGAKAIYFDGAEVSSSNIFRWQAGSVITF